MSGFLFDSLGGTRIIVKWEHDDGEQRRKHKKKRIAKKWLKRYGTWHMPCSKGVIYYFDNTMLMSRNTYAMIKDSTRRKLKFEPYGYHGNNCNFRGNGMRVGETKPINKIKIRDKDILDISLDQGWEITDVDFDDRCPSNMIDELVITVRKSRRNRLEDKKNVEVIQE